MAKSSRRQLTAAQRDDLLHTLQDRFARHPERHREIAWAHVLQRLEAAPDKLWSLQAMERSGGEPDVLDCPSTDGMISFFDCTPESPKDRRSLCYDPAALASRKENKPAHSARGLAEEMGVELLTESEYRHLQTFGAFDQKTSSWISTPATIRKLGGALFCDRRYDAVFVYHNGAESYYAARGFRGVIRV